MNNWTLQIQSKVAVKKKTKKKLIWRNPLTSRDLGHVAHRVNATNCVGVGGVYVAAEDEGCKSNIGQVR